MRWLLRHPSQGLYGRFGAGGELERWTRSPERQGGATRFGSEEAAREAWRKAGEIDAREGSGELRRKGEGKPVAWADDPEEEMEMSVWGGRLADGSWVARVRGGGLEAVANFGQATLFADPEEARGALRLLMGRTGQGGALARYGARLEEVEGDWAQGSARLERARLEEGVGGGEGGAGRSKRGL